MGLRGVQSGMTSRRLAAFAAAALLTVGGCAGEVGMSGPSADPSGGGTVSSSPAQPSPSGPAGAPSPTPTEPGAAPPPSPTPDTPALPIPGRPGKPSPGGASSGTTTVTGTVATGVEPNCVLLNGYLLLGGPRELFTAGALVTVSGRVEPTMMTTCQQGIPLVVESARRG
jgi:hypothetical protein